MRPFAASSAETIRSRQNTWLKDLRQRMLRPGYSSDGLIAIEGEHLLQEAVRSGLRVETLFLREDRVAERDRAAFGGPLTFTVAADAFDHACATESPQGVAALVEMPHWSFDSLLQVETPRLVVLAELQDPGNVGTVIRTVEAFAATGVLLTPGSVHPWNQKVIRASAGSCFRLPVVPLENIALLGRLRKLRIPLYACAAQAGHSLAEADLRGPMAFVIGNEGTGIPKEISPFCSSAIHIPCPGPVESLNAAVAAAILLYEASRQWSHASIRGKAGSIKP